MGTLQTPHELGLPYATWRPGQRLALRTILHAKTSWVIVNAPTGSGKSAIAAALSTLASTDRHVILTATKILQDQYDTFEHLTDLRGASNYPCLASEDELKDWFPIRRRRTVMCDDGPCHLGVECTLRKGGCEYYDAREAFTAAQSGKTNYATWLVNRFVGGGLGDARWLICDEAHELIEQLCGACRVEIPHSLVDGWKTPRTWREWQRWAEDALQRLSPHEDSDHRVKRARLERYLKLLCKIDETWAWDMGDQGWTFEPTVPTDLLPTLQSFPPDAQRRVVLLSATITPSLLHVLGIASEDITYFELPSSFPLDRRPVYFRPYARADYRSMQREDVQQAFMRGIDEVCEDRDDRRGLVHSVSFARGRFIVERSTQAHRMILHEPRQPLADVLRRFRGAGPTAILVSPSITTGVDFPHDDARFQILPKLPFPDQRSNIMKARLRSTPRYSDLFTMTTLVQACGRINRAEDDWGETVVTDGHVDWWYRRNRDLAPEWFDEAVIPTRKWIRPLELVDGHNNSNDSNRSNEE